MANSENSVVTQNTVMEIKKYLSTEDNPLSMAEFNSFWKMLSEEEKEEFRNTELK